MKKLLLLALLVMPTLVMAQSEWETLEKEKPGKEAKSVKKEKKVLDAKYGVGAVPVVDGKVVFETNISVPGVSGSQLYDRTLAAIQNIMEEPCQKEQSRITAVNKKEQIIAATMEEEMVFSTNLLAKDFCTVKYTLIAKCKDGAVNLSFCRISYEYDKGRRTEAHYRADTWITDKETLFKNGTKLYRVNGKFRTKTIDRKDEVFSKIAEAIK